jgi:hypothetical protein
VQPVNVRQATEKISSRIADFGVIIMPSDTWVKIFRCLSQKTSNEQIARNIRR